MDDNSTIDTVIDLDVITPVGQAQSDNGPAVQVSPSKAPLPILNTPPAPPTAPAPKPVENQPVVPQPHQTAPASVSGLKNTSASTAIANPLFENPDSVGYVKNQL